MVAGHKVSIGTWNTRVRANPGSAADWALRLDKAMRGPAARALGEVLEQRFARRSAVIRIERLRLDWVLPEALSAGGDLAGALGRRLADRIEAAIAAGDAPGIRIWPDRHAQAADFALDRLGLRTEPAWAFPDFAALSVLTGAESAAEVLADGGAPVLERLARSGQPPARIAAHLGEVAAGRVIEGLARKGRITEGALTGIARRLALDDLPAAAASQHILCALLMQAASPGDLAAMRDGGSTALADMTRAAIVLLALAQRRSAGESLTTSQGAPAGSGALGALSAGTVGAVLAETAADPVLWSRAVLLAAAAKTAPDAAASSPQSAEATPTSAMALASIRNLSGHSAFAGLAPLLPLCPCDRAGREALRAVALALLPDDRAAEAAREPGFCLLFPSDPHRLPEALPDPDPALWAGQGTLADTALRPGTGAWADLWLARFAARLQGLQASSRGYLQREFLCRPGRIEVTAPDAPIHIVMPPFPLAIVLRMSGLAGLTPPIPHLGRRLLIDLER